MTSITIKYNYSTDETTLKKNLGFDDLPRIHQLDMMQDGIALLTDLYNKKLNELFGDGINKPELDDEDQEA